MGMPWQYFKGREHERNKIKKELMKIVYNPEKPAWMILDSLYVFVEDL